MNRARLLAVLSLNIVLLGACAATLPSPTATAPPPTAPPTAAPTQPPAPTIAPTIAPTLTSTPAPSAPTRTPAPTAVPTSLPKEAAALLGVYVTTFSKEYTTKLLADMGQRASDMCNLAGEYRLTLTPGRFQLRQTELPGCIVPYPPPPSGDWTVTGDQIEFRFGPSYVNGWPCSSTTVYTWKLDGNVIRFSVKDDTCFDRIVMFRSLPWIRQDR
jgi:hypothetical protein